MAKNKRLRVVAGPNGSGKSTILLGVISKYQSGPYVNADDIKKALLLYSKLDLTDIYNLDVDSESFHAYLQTSGVSWILKAKERNLLISLSLADSVLTTTSVVNDYDAAMAADFIRYQLLKKGETFTFETVLSDASKVDFLKHAINQGFKIYLYFICTVDPAINIDRVHQRVLLDGHDVPEKNIVDRYHKTLKLLPHIIPLCHRVYFFDNSDEERNIDPIAEIDADSNIIYHSDTIPKWLNDIL